MTRTTSTIIKFSLVLLSCFTLVMSNNNLRSLQGNNKENKENNNNNVNNNNAFNNNNVENYNNTNSTNNVRNENNSNNANTNNKNNSFSNSIACKKDQETVNLGVAANFVLLSQSGITDVPSSAITGNVGTSPITGAALLLTCSEVTGNIYQVDAAGPPCFRTDSTYLAAAISSMTTAYNKANLQKNPKYTNLATGDISGLTLGAGLYKWTSSVVANSQVTINGNACDIWVFQIAGDLTVANNVNFILEGGALNSNIFWIVAGAYVQIGVGASFEGNVLAKAGINLQTGATVNGRLLAQTAITLQMNTIVAPVA